jgi:hypothetical protein
VKLIAPVDFPHAAADPRTWVPDPGFQRKFLASNADDCLGGGAAGPGKTDILLWLWMRIVEHPWLAVLLLRRTRPELIEMRDRAEVYYKHFGGQWVAKDERFVFPAGGWIRMGYCDQYKHVQRYMGIEYTGIGIDEMGQFPQERWVTLLMSRIRTSVPEARPYLWFRATANPGGEGHAWVKRRYLAKCGADGSRIYKDPETGLSRQFCPGRIADNSHIDPGYVRRLNALPERERMALRDGNWDAAEGIALEELDWRIHSQPRLDQAPDYWTQWGALDWGFSHWCVFVWLALDELGIVHVLDSVWMRRLLPRAIAERVGESVPIDQLMMVYCSPDCWNLDASKSDSNPQVIDAFTAAEWPVTKANTDRVQRLQIARDLVSYKGRDTLGGDVAPGIVFHDTPGNRRLFDQCSGLTTDPDKPETVLKVDATAGGEGGDDGWDALSFGLASHLDAPEKPKPELLHAFDRAALAATADKSKRHTSHFDSVPEERDVEHDPVPPSPESAWEVL